MGKHVLVDITAAMEYAKKYMKEYAKQKAEEQRKQYNDTHKRNIKDATVEELNVNFNGLMFGYGFYTNNYKFGESACFNIPIDDFIVNINDDE